MRKIRFFIINHLRLTHEAVKIERVKCEKYLIAMLKLFHILTLPFSLLPNDLADHRADAGDNERAENGQCLYQTILRQRRTAEGFSDI